MLATLYLLAAWFDVGSPPRAAQAVYAILAVYIFFAAAIIIAAFLPLFTLSGVEGNIFGPMARTYAYALAGGLLATLFLIRTRDSRAHVDLGGGLGVPYGRRQPDPGGAARDDRGRSRRGPALVRRASPCQARPE